MKTKNNKVKALVAILLKHTQEETLFRENLILRYGLRTYIKANSRIYNQSYED